MAISVVLKSLEKTYTVSFTIPDQNHLYFPTFFPLYFTATG